jgi:pSer/pThr/pTyr-binding forkhead associated (FHA) protein
MTARLVPLDGGTAIEIIKELNVLGRNDDCDIQINHTSISKIHCILVVNEGLITVRDLGSTNGTRINGQRVRRGVLTPNDVIGVAGFKFQYIVGDLEIQPIPTSENNTSDIVEQIAMPSAEDSSESIQPLSPTAPILRRSNLPDHY